MTSSFTFHVTNRATTANRMILTGTTSYMPLQFLTINRSSDPTALTHGSINRTSTTGTIVASQTEFATLSNPLLGIPFNLVVLITERSDGWVDVTDLQVPGFAPQIARLESDVHELAGTAAAIDERLAHDLSGDIVGELRKLNRRVESIERLLMEARDGSDGLRATGSDPR